MEYYEQKFGNIGKKSIVRIVGFNHNDVIIKQVGTEFTTALRWESFRNFYRKMEPYECNYEDYEGADLDV